MEIAKTIINLLVGLVVFVTGMNLMSSGLKASAGRQIRHLFKKIKNNRIAAAGIGAGTTAIIQSSGATMVMVLGFLGAGMLTFGQGAAVVLGAFLGTTVTGLLVSLSTFSFTAFLMATAFIGFVLGFFKSPTIKSIGEILVGFGILFFGLEAMKGAFAQEDIRQGIVTMLQAIDFPLLLLLIGVVLTAITQSSSATNGIVIVMIATNTQFLSSGFYLVLGATIGAMMPMIISSFKAEIQGKRVCYSLLIVRTIGAIVATLIIWAVSSPLFSWLSTSFPAENAGLILAIFTVIYNLIFLILFLPLIPVLEKVSTRIFIDKEAERKKKLLFHISEDLMITPPLATLAVKKEIEHMFNLARDNYLIGYAMMIDQDLSKAKELEDVEENIDYLNNALSDYMIALSTKVNYHDEAKIGAYYHVINDIERIGDHAYNFYLASKKMKEAELSFSDKAKGEFDELERVILQMFEISLRAFEYRKPTDLNKLHELEAKTDELKAQIADAHFERIKRNECNNQLSPFHSTFLSELERVADHLTNVGYSIINPTGDEETHGLNKTNKSTASKGNKPVKS